MCPKGYASETGLALFISGPPIRRPLGCQPCPSGYFQEVEGQKSCIECPNKAKSRNDKEATVSVFECEGITRINWDSEVVAMHSLTIKRAESALYIFIHTVFYWFDIYLITYFVCSRKNNQNLTRLEVDECFSNPCQNGGNCNKLEQTGFSCECRSGFAGISSFSFLDCDYKSYLKPA